MNLLCNYRVGRICLHFMAMIVDHKVLWHLTGISREFLLHIEVSLISPGIQATPLKLSKSEPLRGERK